ncbi:hypothetical protein BJY04DRAFT_181051 [Aspergillus karnatakaensis]|uniref:uncharacterized protein n=1 Tax=Aspergillus karnatakaensis TaxID=1810916 RepID=UPI003CCCB901
MSAIVANAGFESGNIFPWAVVGAVYPNTAVITPSNPSYSAFAGDFYSDLQSAPGNRANTISQHITGLVPGTNYTVSVQALSTSNSNGANYCSAGISTGVKNQTIGIAQASPAPEQWGELSGWYVADGTEDVLNLWAGCTFSGSSYTGHVLFDEVSFVEV